VTTQLQATATVPELFRLLETGRLRYAVLRNYEQLPDLRDGGADLPATDIDFVMDSGDIPAFRQILTTLAETHGWDALTECDHWTQSSVRRHHIEVFRLYRISPPRFLQLDIFHAYLVWGLPLFDEAQMLQGRLWREDGLLTHIDPLKENVFYLLKILGLMGPDRTARKVNRYRERMIGCCLNRGEQFRTLIRDAFSPYGVHSLDALRRGDLALFSKKMRAAKIDFLLRYLLHHPLLALRDLAARFRENRLRFRTRQCGFILTAHAASPAEGAMLGSVMDDLVKSNFIDEWTRQSAGNAGITRKERAVMEQGGLVVKWVEQIAARIDVSELKNREAVTGQIIRCLISRHRALFCRRTAAETSAFP
jgi:hypothetical protein